MSTPRPRTMASLQEEDYGSGRDYSQGSPHLTHRDLRQRVEDDLTGLVRELVARHGRCRVLEVGAGHGTFTQVLVDAGAQVTVTEMSRPSADHLGRRFADVDAVTVVHDPDADRAPALVAQGCELIAFISVLHHIPDYVAAVDALVERLPAGGAFYSTQDPVWYPDRSALGLATTRASYLLWRLGQGDLRRGLRTRIRRLRGVRDESTPADMVEFHVVRQGVDQKALVALLEPAFTDVRLSTYWSTQSRLLQAAGRRTRLRSDFAIVATGRRSSG